MRILIVSPMGIFPERMNGPAINAYNMAKAFASLGNECWVVAGTSSPHALAREIGDHQFEVYPSAKDWGGAVSRYQFKRSISDPRTLLKVAVRMPSALVEAKRVLKLHSPDIVLFNLLPFGSLVLLPFVRLTHSLYVLRSPVWWPLELEKYAGSGVVKAVGSKLACVMARRFDAIVTQSSQMRELIRRDLGLRANCVVIPNGVDLGRFGPGRERPEGAQITVLFVGRLSEEKGVETLLRALSLVKQDVQDRVRLVIVGGGGPMYVSHLQRLTDSLRLGDRVQFRGEVNWNDLPGLYRRADIFVLPSYWEAMPLTLLEAMASGLPCICTDIAGVTQTVTHHSNGLLFKPGDHRKLADHIVMLLRDEALRKRLSDGSLKTVVSFGWDRVAERYLHLFRELVGPHPGN